MKHRLRVFFRLAIIWLIYFEAARIIFLAYHISLSKSLSFYEIGMPLLLGLRMDAAMTGYWLIIPGLTLTVSFFISDRVAKWIIQISFYLLALFSAAVITLDLELYHHWNFRMDNTPLLYAGSEGVGSVSALVVMILGIIFGLQLVVLFLVFRKYVAPQFYFDRGSAKLAVPMFFITVLLFIPIRSSFRVAPLNTGVVYFHKSKSFPNHAGINVVWNFIRSLISDNSYKYPSGFLGEPETIRAFESMMSVTDSTALILNTNKPNVLLIVLESFTSKIIEPLGGMKGVTPNLNKLCEEGILFDSIYASGDRTDKGIVSILSAYPAQPKTSIIKFPNKAETLPSLPRVLSNQGYHSTFVYGGDIGFANMESYVNLVGFSHVTEDDDFDLLQNTSKWGVHDEFVFDRLLNETDTAVQPFFKTFLSLSSHEPFDVPNRKKSLKTEEELFLNSCTYTDSCLGSFIKESKTKSWWKNTLVIITADHGHRNPGKHEVGDPEKFKIPMLWLGGAVDSIYRVHTVGSQIDLVSTLLHQLNIEASSFRFSKDLLNNSTQPFAVYSFNNGYGYINPSGQVVYDFDYKNFSRRDSTFSNTALIPGKAFMQTLFNDYNKR